MSRRIQEYQVWIVAGVLLLLMVSGCSTSPPSMQEASACPDPKWQTFNGSDGQEVIWAAMLSEVFEADVIVVGEQHNNAAGHELERRMTKELLEKYPDASVAMEMFERHEQTFVDLYFAGKIQAKTLATITDSANWGGGKNAWEHWYQPIVDCVKEYHTQGAYLKAANCPRPFVKLARLEGFEIFSELDNSTTQLVTLPEPDVNDTAYRERFVKLMKPEEIPANVASEKKAKSSKKAMPSKKAMSPMAAASLDPDAYFRAQQTWDASMAASVLEVAQDHPKVILFVGEFHMAYDGGLLRRLSYRYPDLKIASVSMLKKKATKLEPEDLGRAQFVIYTH
jgi:uncharacterized iron-regulated protein